MVGKHNELYKWTVENGHWLFEGTVLMFKLLFHVLMFNSLTVLVHQCSLCNFTIQVYGPIYIGWDTGSSRPLVYTIYTEV